VVSIPFGRTTYKRDNGNMPRLRLVNMIAEPAPTNPEGSVLISRLPTVVEDEIGTGPVDGIFQKNGVLGGDTFVVSGTSLYRDGVSVGSVPGSGLVKFAASATELVVLRVETATAYSYKPSAGTPYLQIPLANGDRPVTGYRSVAFVAGLFVFAAVTDATVPGHYWFWSGINDARTIDDLDFAAAESEPDELLDVLAIGDNLYLLGQSSGEVWQLTGVAALPFSRISQRQLGRGVIATGCAQPMDNTVLFIGSDRIVFRMEDVAKRISDHGIEERIRASTTWRTYQYAYEGHLYFNIRLDTETLQFDVSNSTWIEASTYGVGNFAALCAATIDGQPLFGMSFTGTGEVHGFGEHGGTDGNAAAFERIFHAGMPLGDGGMAVSNLIVEANSGATPLDSGPGADPRIEMRFSRDGGRTFSSWRETRLGAKGEYRRIARFGACGYFGPPGALFEFRCTENVPLRISRVGVNETLSGRGW
jgi:hypothetical protein